MLAGNEGILGLSNGKNGKRNGNWDNIGVILVLYRENGNENGNYYSIIGYIFWGFIGKNGKENGNYDDNDRGSGFPTFPGFPGFFRGSPESQVLCLMCAERPESRSQHWEFEGQGCFSLGI